MMAKIGVVLVVLGCVQLLFVIFAAADVLLPGSLLLFVGGMLIVAEEWIRDG